MIGQSKPKTLLLSAGLALCTLFTIEVSAQVKFVQITDPHIFDDKTPEDRENNKAALAAAVRKINERMGQGANYDFAVITGDLGVEALIVKKPAPTINETGTANSLRERAKELADILRQSQVRRWVFVAGNNDLDDEKPVTIKYYNNFIDALKNELRDREIIDLNRDAEVNVYSTNGLSFIGFNDASFKNQNDASRLKCAPADKDEANDERKFPIHARQLKEVRTVYDRIRQSDISLAYVFYHRRNR
jgi:Calcineurin-like phosphoesterase